MSKVISELDDCFYKIYILRWKQKKRIINIDV